MKLLMLVLGLLLSCMASAGELRVVDDDGREIVLAAPARRIVSLAPHTTELLFEAGAGHLVVGTVEHADHPEAARRIPRVGNHVLLDIEAIVRLQPDLVVGWLHGNSEKQMEKVRKLGMPMFYSRPQALGDIPSSLLRIGRLAGTEPQAREAADAFERRLAQMKDRYAHRPSVRVFFQVWARPLLTISGRQVISDVIRLCGGRNVFAEEQLLVPTVDAEAVVAARPEAVLATGLAGEAEDAFAVWRRLPGFAPTEAGNLILLETEALGRPSSRILDGAAVMCDELERVRARRRP